MKPAPFVATCVLFLLASGCMQPATTKTSETTASPSTALTGHAITESFDGAALPTGWTPHKGTWTMASGPASHPKVIQGVGDADPGFSSLTADVAGTFRDVKVDVDFVMISGEHPQGAGVVVDWRDGKNYIIIRYSITEVGWHLFTLNDGNRNKQEWATKAGGPTPQFNEWVHLRVVQIGDSLKVYQGETLVIDYTLASEDSHTGAVGIFSRGNTVAQFDDFKVVLD